MDENQIEKTNQQVQSQLPIDNLMKAITESGDNIEKLKILLELQEKWEKREALKAYVKAMSEFKLNPPTIIKTGKASFQTSKGQTEYEYAPLESVSALIGKGLAEVGISHKWITEQKEGKIKVTCILTHILGHSESTFLEAEADNSGGKNNIQAIGSTITYLEKYTLTAITGTAAKGLDNDGNTGGNSIEYITEDQEREIVALIQKSKVTPDKFFKYLKIEKLKQLPVTRFDEVKKILNDRIKEGQK